MSTGFPVEQLISLQGLTITISRNTKGALDSYGDRARSFSNLGATEKISIQENRVRMFRANSGDVQGNLQDASHKAYLLASTAVQIGDILVTAGGTRYEVKTLQAKEFWGSVTHYEANVDLLTEDTS